MRKIQMRKEFPVDRWLRKHMGTGRSIIAILAIIVLLFSSTVFLPQALALSILIWFLLGFTASAAFLVACGFYWLIKYPPQVEFCKECGRAKPEKFDD